MIANIGMLGLAWLVQGPIHGPEGPGAAEVTPRSEPLPAFRSDGAPVESDYWTVERLQQPVGSVLEVGGLALAPDGTRVAVSTRRGEVWWLDGAFEHAATDVHFTLAAEGLQEPLGLLWHDGWLHAACRGELLRMRDRDGDERLDVFEPVASGWPLSGSYHEYDFGPVRGPNGNFWITTNKPFGGEHFGAVKWRGFAFEITPDGTWTPRVAGLRSPAGITAAPWGELFYTDNQGEWVGASKLALLENGTFQGHPHGAPSTSDPMWPYPPIEARGLPKDVTMPVAASRFASYRLPAIWFPYDKLGRSPSGFVWDESGGQFGPFAGQVFVGDQYDASVSRVDLEWVDGVWQGAAFPFRRGLPCGVIRLLFGPDGSLLAGMSDRGWGSRGADTDGVARLRWTGHTPFEVAHMRVTPTGFRLEFTAPADPATMTDPRSFEFESYTYRQHEAYGSPEVDRAEPRVTRVIPSEDARSVELVVTGLREGYVHELHAPDLRAATGERLLHARAYYTLIRLPD